jgi:hypothetical protein
VATDIHLDQHHSQWDQILSQAEFAYNDSVNMSTRKSPFHIVYGMKTRGVLELRYLEQNEFKSVREEYFVVEMQNLHNQIKEQLQNRSKEYKHKVDQHRGKFQFEVGIKF